MTPKKFVAPRFILILSFLLTSLSVPLVHGQKTTREEATEVLIAKAEDEAIEAIKRILERKKGTADEPDLLFRMAEMYLRRAKTTRFFEMHVQEATKTSKEQFRWSPSASSATILKGKSREQVEMASVIFEKIEKKFPKYQQLDSVLFYQGFCNQQLAKYPRARVAYLDLVEKYPTSRHLVDARVALGEMNYDDGRFSEALKHFDVVVQMKDVGAVPYSMYKSSWAEYNLKRSDHAFALLKRILGTEFTNEKAIAFKASLRPEIIKDLALFFSDHGQASAAIDTLRPIVSPEEFPEVVGVLSSIYTSHSRHKDAIRLIQDSDEFLKDPQQKVSLKVTLAETHEILKDYPSVVKTLQQGLELCKEADAQKTEGACHDKLPRYTAELTQKLWDFWKKGNTAHRPTIEALFQLQFELKAGPESKAFLAYAEFLFQANEFAKASLYYEKHSDLLAESKKTTEAAEALYSSLVTAEKITDAREKNSRKNELATKYVTLYPQGAANLEARFQIGYLAYVAKDNKKAEESLMQVASAKTKDKTELREKAQDLVLDIYNAETRYEQIAKLSQEIIKENPAEARKAKMRQLIEEADFANIPNQKGVDATKVHEIYWGHYNKHPDSKLNQTALWLAFSNAMKHGYKLRAAEYAGLYAEKFPKDAKSTAALQQVAIFHLEYGLPRQALQTLRTAFAGLKPEERQDKVEALIELTTVVNDPEETALTAKAIGATVAGLKPVEQARIYARQMELSPSPETERKILSLGIEPYVSDIKARELTKKFDSQPRSTSFAQAKSIVGNQQASPEARASARLIQARVLEEEFTSQSTKTSLEKISLVIALKTEKLAKTQEALLSAASLSPDARTQSMVNSVLEKIYTHFVQSMRNLTVRDQITAEEDKQLRDQLKELIQPIEQKLTEVRKKDAAPTPAAASEALWNVANSGEKESIAPLTRPMELKPYQISLANWSIEVKSESAKNCLAKPSAGVCKAALKEVSHLPGREKESALLSALVETTANQPMLASWILTSAIEKNKDFAPYYYVRSFVAKDGQQEDLRKAYQLGLQNAQSAWALALTQFKAKDCDAFLKTMNEGAGSKRSVASNSDLTSRQLPLIAECMATNGEKEPAYELLTRDLKKAPSLEVALQAARIAEDHLIDFAKARGHYQQALALSAGSPELKDWLQMKLNYLSKLLPEAEASKERKAS